MPADLWTLTAIALVALTVAMIVIAHRAGRAPHARCPACRYDLRGHLAAKAEPPWTCPECAAAFESSQVLYLRRIPRRVIAASMLAGLAAWFAWCTPDLRRDGWRGAVPLWVFVLAWPIDREGLVVGPASTDQTASYVWTDLENVRRAEGWLDRVWAKRLADALLANARSCHPNVQLDVSVYDFTSLWPTLRGDRHYPEALTAQDMDLPEIDHCLTSTDRARVYRPMHARAWKQEALYGLTSTMVSALNSDEWIDNGGDITRPYVTASYLIVVGSPALQRLVRDFVHAYQATVLGTPGTRMTMHNAAGDIEFENVTDLRFDPYEQASAGLTHAIGQEFISAASSDHDASSLPQWNVDHQCTVLITQGNAATQARVHAVLARLRANAQHLRHR